MKSRNKISDYFWPSLTDLMTSLFFLMLILFGITQVRLLKHKDSYRIIKNLEHKIDSLSSITVDASQLNNIRNLQTALKQLTEETYDGGNGSTKLFRYDSQWKRIILNNQIIFGENQYTINEESESYLTEVGNALESLIQSLRKSSPNQKFAIIIEGMTSSEGSENRNYELSYRRALAIRNYWADQGILDNDITELQIAGSGPRGVGRNTSNDEMNRTILVQIVPKFGIR